MREIMKTKSSFFVLALASLLALVPPAFAQEEEVCRDILEAVEQGVPKEVGDPAFLKRLLEPTVGPQFADRFIDLAQQAALPAVKSRLRLAQRHCVPDQEGHVTCRLSNFRKTELLKFDERQGKAAYLNLTREWSPKLGENKLPDAQAMELARGVIKSWGIPDEELALQLADLRRLNIAGGPKLDDRPAEFLSTEVHVRFPRHIGGVPVFDSFAQLAFDVRGQVARMRVFWPSFGIVPGLEPNPLSREDVVMNTAVELSEGAVCGSLSRVEAHIAYVLSKEVETPDPTDEGSQDEVEIASESAEYVPALVVYAYPRDPKEDSGELVPAGRQLVARILDSRDDGK
jgi:hypothetical protein